MERRIELGGTFWVMLDQSDGELWDIASGSEASWRKEAARLGCDIHRIKAIVIEDDNNEGGSDEA